MAVKRRDSPQDGIPSRKKLRTEEQSDTDDIFIAEDGLDSDDSVANYTDNGSKRAKSEASRQWDYVCEYQGCGRRFNRPCHLEDHTRTHTNERPFICTYDDCDKTFRRKDHLLRHLRNGHDEAERNFVCDWKDCGKKFSSKPRLLRHKEVHESKFYCTAYPPCNLAFRKEKTLEAHIKFQHLEAKPYTCTYVDPKTGEQCTHGYQTAGALRRHALKTHLEEKEDVHFCMICIAPGAGIETVQNEAGETISVPKEPLSFATHEELLAHTRVTHPPVCSECGIKFKTRSNLKAHMDSVHAEPTAQKQFPCPKPGCDSVFNRKHNLHVHIQSVHEKKIKYFCTSDAMNTSKHPDLKVWDGKNACGAAFRAKSSLDQHIRTHHLGLQNRKVTRKLAKPSKKKPEPSALTLLTGVGYEKGRDVPCLVRDCEYRFYMDRDLRRHLRAAHKFADPEIEDMLLERDATTGGQFWIGGLDDHEPTSMFDSTEPSVPQTPAPYYMDQTMSTLPIAEGYGKANGAPLGFFDPRLEEDDQMLDAEEAEMDIEMGLDDVPRAVDAHEGLQWDMLAPVQEYNYQEL